MNYLVSQPTRFATARSVDRGILREENRKTLLKKRTVKNCDLYAGENRECCLDLY